MKTVTAIKPRESKIKEFRDIVHSLPQCNRETLKFLLEHLLSSTQQCGNFTLDSRQSIRVVRVVFYLLLLVKKYKQNSAFASVFVNIYCSSLHRLPVSDNKRLCSTVSCGKETENKLLLQICEAEQVSDFERILNSNAILCERRQAHVWRGCGELASSASVLPRPRSAYSLHAVSQVYHHLFHQHEESLQPLIQRYRQEATDDDKPCPPYSILQDNWFEHLQDLSQFYEDDVALQQEIETITDRIVAEEVKAAETKVTSPKNKNFNVNLTDLIGLHVNGEGFSPISNHDGPSPDVDKVEHEAEYKEWLGASMSANSEFDPISQGRSDSVDCLAESLDSVKIDTDAKVPTITFSNCCDGCARSELPNNTEVVNLAVPSIESADESRPPM
ncbi:uncharacterized protein LOC126376399 [Pectinophora gossypiella]|uniref:uncharacterized protein LOC126376399 n=1 Tax=Pectinophora gossypiella TaxID=13191 RepID=UPI00214E1018|nr:uncharacterized protein LOC126376399 [Pectinophora gossypiella]